MSHSAARNYYPDEPAPEYEPEYFTPVDWSWMERCAENSRKDFCTMPIAKTQTVPPNRPTLTLVPMPPPVPDDATMTALLLLDSLEELDAQCNELMKIASREEIAAIARTRAMIGIWRTLRRFMAYGRPPRCLCEAPTLRLFE